MSDIEIRAAGPDDAEQLLEIYRYYVEHTAITFEYDVPQPEEFKNRIENTLKKYPYLCLIQDGKIAGYSYAGPFVGRAAYGWSAEMTIYLRHGLEHRGLGRILYTAMETELKKMGILNLYACIGYPSADDEYLNGNSAGFHEHMGYRKAGIFYNCGRKFGRWYHMIWMEKMIGEHGKDQSPVKRWTAQCRE